VEPAPLKSNVRFNVGGRIFEVSRSIIEQHPNTMLARMIDATWKRDDYQPGDALFIDRSGDRFQYVLDYMRDGKVFLPVTESRAAVAHELEYFGFENVEQEKALSQATLDGGRVMSSISSNLCEEMDAMDKDIQHFQREIKSIENKGYAIRAAHLLFMRASDIPADVSRFTVTISDRYDKDFFGKATRHAMTFLSERLATYGLKLVKYPRHYISSTFAVDAEITLERVPNA
jgi:hypothetical protein